MKFEDPATEEQLRVRELVWESVQGLLGKPKTPQLIDLILKTCREALDGEYFVAYHDSVPESDLLLLFGKKTYSGFYTLETIVIQDAFQKQKENQDA